MAVRKPVRSPRPHLEDRENSDPESDAHYYYMATKSLSDNLTPGENLTNQQGTRPFAIRFQDRDSRSPSPGSFIARSSPKGPERNTLFSTRKVYRRPQTHDIFDFGARRTLPEKLFKVIIIGDPTVGKTSFIQRYVQNSFSREYKGTVGVDFALKVLHWYDSQVVKLQLWDIAGQERFTWMTRVYYKDAHGCVIMFDLTNKHSFENTLKWKKDLDAKCSLADGTPVPCMLLANKCDLQDRKINQAEIEAFHKENNFIGWTETSAKEGLMVNDSMRFLVEVMMQQEGLNNSFDSTGNSLYLTAPEPKKERKCFC